METHSWQKTETLEMLQENVGETLKLIDIGKDFLKRVQHRE